LTTTKFHNRQMRIFEELDWQFDALKDPGISPKRALVELDAEHVEVAQPVELGEYLLAQLPGEFLLLPMSRARLIFRGPIELARADFELLAAAITNRPVPSQWREVSSSGQWRSGQLLQLTSQHLVLSESGSITVLGLARLIELRFGR